MHILPGFLVPLRCTCAFGKLLSSASMTLVHFHLGPSPALARRTSQKRCSEGTKAFGGGVSHEMRLESHFIHPHSVLNICWSSQSWCTDLWNDGCCDNEAQRPVRCPAHSERFSIPLPFSIVFPRSADSYRWMLCCFLFLMSIWLQ